MKTGGSSIGTGSGIALDGSGNALVTGNFLGTASFATAPTATSLVSATGNYGNYNDVFVAKFGAADGTCAWAVKAGGNSEDMGSGIAVDGSGNALVTGAFSSTATFAAPTTAISLATTGGKDVFVAKFGAADGTCAWAVKAGSSDSDAGYGIALDGGGNALVTGGFQGTASFGTAPTATSLVVAGSNSNSTDVFVAKFGAANGACAWAVRAGGTWTDAGYGIAADGSGNVLITGDFQGTAVFGSTTLVGGAAVRAGYDPSGFVATLAVPATPAPVLTSVSPAAELPGQVVTLTGTGFNSGSIVSFGGVAAAGVSYVSATSVTAVVPVGAGSTVSVATALGTTAAQPFTLLSPADNRTLPAGICTSATPVTLGADSNWHYLLVGGQVALAYNTQGLNLGTVSAELLRADPAAPVRTDGMGRAYLGRNWHLTTSAGLFTGSTVRVRFYALSSEFNQLSAADPANVPNLAALRLTQYSGPNEDCDLTNDAAGAGRRLLTPTTTNGPAGSNFFVSEVAVADHFSEFYLNGGAAPLPVRAATLSGAADGLALYPNPASTGATLTGGQPGTLITVFDPLGRLVATATADATGTAKLALPAGLPAGIYVVHAGPQAVRLTVE